MQFLRQELDLYFKGHLKTFATPLEQIGTEFQKQAWDALLAIPYGETRSYKEQAQRLGNPKAVRAVAAANGQNKVSVMIPCHRVIGSDGKLTGYAGGLNRKQFFTGFGTRRSSDGIVLSGEMQNGSSGLNMV